MGGGLGTFEKKGVSATCLASVTVDSETVGVSAIKIGSDRANPQARSHVSEKPSESEFDESVFRGASALGRGLVLSA